VARYLLDTNICIYIRQQRPAVVPKRFLEIPAGDVVMSEITWGELVYGAEKSRQRDDAMRRLEELASIIPIQPLPADAGLVYGRFRAALEKRGEIIGGNDLWIAAHAFAASLTLVTNNEREFKRIKGIRVENWVG
jgi:tRNA(fMet)-specific endonuclease VapC